MSQPLKEGGVPLWRFGAFEVDLEQQELRKDGVPVPLAPQPFKVLALLVTHAGRMVTRKELQEQLWDDSTFVDFDIGLNRCIKQIRDGLEDDTEGPRFIETRRGLGYRFIAAVQPAQETPSPPDPGGGKEPPDEPWYRRRPGTLLAGLALVVILVFWFHRRPPPSSAEVTVRPAVAVLGFKNLAGKPESNWLSTALSEMLTTELAAGGELRTVPGEDVARARKDGLLSDQESYAPDTLARIHTNLNADFVVLGSYLELETESGGRVRLDLRLQDARTGSTLAAVSETGSEAKLFDLVARSGTELRGKLGVSEMTPEEESNTRATVPSNPEANRLYSEGLARLRSFDALGARDLFQQSLRIEPDFPLTHAALSDAWRILGDLDQTREESRKAFDASRNLSREDQLFIEGRYREASMQWDQAIRAFGALFTLRSDSLGYGLALARAQWSSGKPDDAMATLKQLKALPPPAGEDPQIDLAESIAATEERNSQRADEAAGRAAQGARKRGSKLLLVRALRAQGEALLNLGKLAEAQKAFDGMQQAARSVGDDDSTAYALFGLGKLRLQQEDFSGAESSLEEAGRIWQKNGDRTYAALSSMALGIISEAEGNLPEAQKACEHAVAVSHELGDKPTSARMLLFLGDVLAVEGNLPQAHQKYDQAAAMMAELGSQVGADRSDLALAQLSIAEGHPADAEASAHRVLQDPHLLHAPDLKLAATMVLAQALLAEGRNAEAQQALPAAADYRQAPMLAAGINFGLGQGLAILSERLRASTGRPDDIAEAARRLQKIADDSAGHGNLIRQLQARLAMAELEMRWTNSAAGRAQLTALKLQAQARGFGLIARQAGSIEETKLISLH
ncbi:MAG TPA: winged helix-turn-helix domain-containing protein [Terriglobia bacterium]|nr:winged helix-turn-helix domain-containing protein [Terriglobia bacterium]